MSAPSNENEKEALMKALHHAAGKICRTEQQQSGGAENVTSQMSQSALSALTQMTYHYVTKCLTPDLLNFSSHAGRKTITSDDVMLIARKRSDLSDALEKICDAGNSMQRDKDIFMNNLKSKKKKGQLENRRTSSLLDMSLTQQQNAIQRCVESSSDDEDFLPRNSKKLKTATSRSPCADFEYEDSSSSSCSRHIFSSQKRSRKRMRNASRLSSQTMLRVNEATLSDTSSSEERPVHVGSQKRLLKKRQKIESRERDDNSSLSLPKSSRMGKVEGKSAMMAIELSEDEGVS